MSDMEKKLNDAGVFCHHGSLRRFVECDEFWSNQPYGNRLYFNQGGLDYVPRDILRTAVQLLDKPDENESLRQQLATVTEQRDRAWAALRGITNYPDVRQFVGTIVHDECLSVLAEARENGYG